MSNRRPDRSVRRSRIRAIATGLASCLLLSACDTVGGWFGGDEDQPRLEGERISVLQLAQSSTDPALSSTPVTLPEARLNTEWTMPGGGVNHTPGHLALGAPLRQAWERVIEDGTSFSPLISGPAVANGRVFVLNTDFVLHAFDEQTGRLLWDRSVLRPDQEGEAFGGGVSIGPDGRIYVTTGYGEVVALDAETGNQIWRRRIAGPIRTAPTISEGRVFVLAADNQAIVLAAENGVLQWTHTGILESAALLGGSAVAVANDVAIVPYSSGEVFALRVENGRPAWGDSIATVQRGTTGGGLSDIRGLPVIDRGLVFVVSHGGRTAAINLRTGTRVWEQDVGGINTPAVAGDWVFVLSNEAQLVALSRETGRIRWISQLQQFEDEEERDGPLIWSGPVVAGGRLILTNSLGELVEVSPEAGEVISKTELPDATTIAPVVANNTLYILTNEGELAAYR